MCQRCLELFAASQATEVVRKVVRRVISKVVRRLIRKVISTCTTLRTTLLTRQLMTFDHGSSWFCGRELATPKLGPIGGGWGGQLGRRVRREIGRSVEGEGREELRE